MMADETDSLMAIAVGLDTATGDDGDLRDMRSR
jgi:hypothetical protein